MEFFKNLSGYLKSTDLNINIRGGENQITVSILPKSTAKDVTAKVKPLLLTGTPEELDSQFLEVITKPLSEASGLLQNAADFEAEVASEKKTLSEKKDKKDKGKDKGGKKPEPAKNTGGKGDKGKTTPKPKGKEAKTEKKPAAKEKPVVTEETKTSDSIVATDAKAPTDGESSPTLQTSMFPEAVK